MDDELAIAMSKNPIQHCRSKHIGTKHHFNCDYVDNGYVNIEHVKDHFEEIRRRIGIAKMKSVSDQGGVSEEKI